MLTPPSSPLSNPDSLLPTLWSPEDPRLPILHSIGFTVDGWSFPDSLPTWEQVQSYEHQHLHSVSFNPEEELVHTRKQQCFCCAYFSSED